MKLVRKNDEFIVIESRGSYHKVGLSEIDDLIILLCEAKRVDPAKANKSIGENLFEEQERCTRLAMQYVDDLHRKYGRVRQLMGIPLTDIYTKLKSLAEENRRKNRLDDDTHFDAWVESALDSREIPHVLEDADMVATMGVPKDNVVELMNEWVNNNRYPTYMLQRPCDVFLAIDPANGKDMSMTITKGRDRVLTDVVDADGRVYPQSKVRQFYGDLPFVPTPKGGGISFSIRNGSRMPPPSPRKQESMTPLKQAMIKTFEEQLPGRVSESPYLYGDPKKSIIDMLDMPRIPHTCHKSDLRGYLLRQGQWYRPAGSPLRNPLVGGKRSGQSELPQVAPQYRTLRTAYRERMARIAEDQYVATAFPKRFDRLNHKLPGALYTADVAYFVLTGNPNEDITSMSQIQSKAVKAWEC